MPLLMNDTVKQALYNQAITSLQEKLDDDTIDMQLKRFVELIFKQVKKAKASWSSGLSTDELIQILKVSEQAMVTDHAMGMHTALNNAISIQPCIELMTKLQEIHTEESNKLRGLLFCLAGLILILTSVALAVFTAGIASPLSFLGISLGVSIITSGILGLSGMALGIKKTTESVVELNKLHMHLNNQVTEISKQTEQIPLERFKINLITKFNQEYFQLKGKSKQDVGELGTLINRIKSGEFTRTFDLIKTGELIDKTAYESLLYASKIGKIREHLKTVAKSLSTLFLDEKLRLKTDFIDFLGQQGAWGCSIAMDLVPSIDVSSIQLGSFDSGYVRVKNETKGLNILFYVNKNTNERIQLNITNKQLEEYDSKIKSLVEPRPLLANDLQAIELKTGHNASLSKDKEDQIITALLQALITLYTAVCSKGYPSDKHSSSAAIQDFTWATINTGRKFNESLETSTVLSGSALMRPGSKCLSGKSLQDAKTSINEYMLQVEEALDKTSTEAGAISKKLEQFRASIDEFETVSDTLSKISMTFEQQAEVEAIWETDLLNRINTICVYMLALPNIASCLSEKERAKIQDIVDTSCDKTATVAPNLQIKKMVGLTTISEDDETEDHPHPHP